MTRRTSSTPEGKKFIMQATRLLAAALLAVAAVGAMAQEIDARDQNVAASAVSGRTREAVTAEVRNARLAGTWVPSAELRDAAVAPPVAPTAATRQDVKRQLAAARATHQLPRSGELM